MPSYIWHGITSTGKKTQGTELARNRLQLKINLIKQNIFPVKIKLNLFYYLKIHHKIGTKHITHLIEELSILINANISIIKAFTIISQDEQNPQLKDLINNCKNSISEGKSLYQTLQQHQQHFSRLACNLINAGEQSGTLDIMLLELADHLKKSESQNRRIIKALLYPAVILSITIIVTIILLIFVIPQFATMFDNFGAKLPNYTQLIINFSNLLKKFWKPILAIIFSTMICVKIASHYSTKFCQLLEELTLKIPIIKNILTNDIIFRLTNTLSLMLSSGIPLLRALDISASTITNFKYRHAIYKTRELITNGETFHGALNTQHLFPTKMIQLIALGEETGSLDSMLKKVSTIYNEKLNSIINNLNTLLEPTIILILGSIVGSLVIGMYLPIFSLGNIV